MNVRNLLVAVAAVIVLGAAFTLRSQGLTDGIKVTLPEAVTVGDVVLDPGEYEIRRASMNADQVLRIFSNDKLKYQTVVLTIPTLGKETPEDSKVILHHIGDKFYFDKIWMEGKDYGYEFPLPDRVRALQRELAVNVAARYEAVPQTSSVESTSVKDESSNQVAAVVTSDQDKERAEALAKEQQDAQERENRERERLAKLDQERQEQLAREQAELDRISVAAVQPEQPPAHPVVARSESTSVAIQDNSQDRADQSELPATAAGWLSYVLGGGLLMAMAGFFRKTRTQE